MFRLLALMFILGYISCACAAISLAEDLPILGVIGGSQANPAQIPYQVILRAKKAHICGGALIAKKIVATAAHCTHDEALFSLTVVAGTNNRFTGGKSIRVDHVEEHPKYSPATNEYDFAILILQKQFTYGATIQPIELPKFGEVIPAGTKAIVSGWGIEAEKGDKPVELKYVNVSIWKKSDCYNYLKVIKAPVYCGGDQSGNNNACSGDSGGPLVYNGKLFGVVSFGFGCGTPKKPAIYTDVSALRDWIKQTAHI